jgi:hypothetical protein
MTESDVFPSCLLSLPSACFQNVFAAARRSASDLKVALSDERL